MLYSFWKPYNIEIGCHNYNSTDKFISIERDISIPPSPTSNSFVVMQSEKELNNVRHFLKKWFGNPPKSPQLDNPVCENDQIVLAVKYRADGVWKIAGTIRYKYTGNFNGHDINIIDCFCIHPEWRKCGVGTYLLAALHKYTNSIGKKWSIFLKEGGLLPIAQTPFYSSLYRYRRVRSNICTPAVQTIRVDDALKIIYIFKMLRPGIFIIANRHTLNQKWRLYTNGRHWMLAVIQDTYQIHPFNYGKIGLCVGVIESIGFPPSLRNNALLQLTEDPEFSWIWLDTIWVDDNSQRSMWSIDGPFHWYAYQWTSSIRPGRDYCIMI